MTSEAVHYRQPGWFTRNVFNRAVARLTRMGLSVWGSRVLEVPGRRTGQPHQSKTQLNPGGEEQGHVLLEKRSLAW